jgi:hypothetical protein
MVSKAAYLMMPEKEGGREGERERERRERERGEREGERERGRREYFQISTVVLSLFLTLNIFSPSNTFQDTSAIPDAQISIGGLLGWFKHLNADAVT